MKTYTTGRSLCSLPWAVLKVILILQGGVQRRKEAHLVLTQPAGLVQHPTPEEPAATPSLLLSLRAKTLAAGLAAPS